MGRRNQHAPAGEATSVAATAPPPEGTEYVPPEVPSPMEPLPPPVIETLPPEPPPLPPPAPSPVMRELVRVRAKRHISEEVNGKVVHFKAGEVFDIKLGRAIALGQALLEDAEGEELGLPKKK